MRNIDVLETLLDLEHIGIERVNGFWITVGGVAAGLRTRSVGQRFRPGIVGFHHQTAEAAIEFDLKRVIPGTTNRVVVIIDRTVDVRIGAERTRQRGARGTPSPILNEVWIRRSVTCRHYRGVIYNFGEQIT